MKATFLTRPSQISYAIRMTPLIDIIFLLMIFFLLTVNFQKPEGVIQNQLPRLGDRTGAAAGQDWEIVRLRVKMIRDNDGLKILLQEREVHAYDELLQYLNQLPDDILIVIEPDDQVAYKHVIGVYNTCIKSNKKDIVFSISA